jgi:tetratricopeptide (TPR) repeat protein
MESFSKTLDTYTGSYLIKRRKKRLLWGACIFGVLLLAGALILITGKSSASASAKGERAVSKRAILADWQKRDWDKVLADCTVSLESKSLDPFYLGFAGLSAYYKASELPDGEEKNGLVDRCIVYLRKTLVVTESGRGGRIPRAEMKYVLAKAYYAKGSSYFDSVVKWMEASLSDGYLGDDSREYLAVAYAGLGNSEKAVENFELALKRHRTDLLLIAAGKAYIDEGKSDRAEALLLEALSRSHDVLAREKCRFTLAQIYELRGETAKAQDQIELVIGENPESADAHYRLGLIYQKLGDAVRARAEWRRAVSIDPMHVAARQKLAEKL